MTPPPKEPGQILPHLAFGLMLTKLAREANIIVEIGTWYGQGSTLALASGMERPNQRLITLEADPERWEHAAAFHKADPRITCLCARTLDILDQLPATIDLLLLDGDKDTNREFDALHEGCAVIALDDTNEWKNRRNFEWLESHGWKCEAHHPEDRLGWAVFRRP